MRCFCSGNHLLSGMALTIILTCSACAPREYKREIIRSTEIVPRDIVEVRDRGVVQHVWEEPMVDTIEVPPGLDPEGHYYRPAHREVVEIRQGRWRSIQDEEELEEER
jgi:hypothetical protein